MNEINYQKSYREYKAELDGVLQKTAEGFVRIGYLLKVARDTNVLEESGYKSVAEFAEKEYNLNRTQVSRFISINDKFSEGGYSDRLLPAYQGYGYAKLTIMLQLPDVINEELTPDYSKAEIQSIKEELDEERRISDIEVMIEPESKASLEANNLMKAVVTLGEDEPELYKTVFYQNKVGYTVELLKDDLCPNEEQIYIVRVPGVGRLILSLKTAEHTTKLVNARSGEKEEYTWQQLLECFQSIVSNDYDTAEASYEILYNKPFPKKEEKHEVAPVQQKKPVAKKESKVVKAKVKQEEPKREEPKNEVEDAEDNNIEGQMVIQDYKEVMPVKDPVKTDVEDAKESEPVEAEQKAIKLLEIVKHYIESREYTEALDSLYLVEELLFKLREKENE